MLFFEILHDVAVVDVERGVIVPERGRIRGETALVDLQSQPPIGTRL